jgi:UDP-2-acetamido-3-amino-2,3-dideoxy-glucuronate N-acetyltransferase
MRLFCSLTVSMEHEYFAHESCYIDDGAIVGKGTKIWHFSHVMGRAAVGEKCNIGQNVYIDNDVSIGNGVKIQNNVSVYKGVIVEDDVFLGPSMVFTNVINPRSFIERKSEFRATRLGKGSTVGANATILCGVTIGQYALVGAGAVVIRDVPDYALVVGNPSRQVGWVSRSGTRLEFDNQGRFFAADEGIHYILENEKVTAQH